MVTLVTTVSVHWLWSERFNSILGTTPRSEGLRQRLFRTSALSTLQAAFSNESTGRPNLKRTRVAIGYCLPVDWMGHGKSSMTKRPFTRPVKSCGILTVLIARTGKCEGGKSSSLDRMERRSVSLLLVPRRRLPHLPTTLSHRRHYRSRRGSYRTCRRHQRSRRGSYYCCRWKGSGSLGRSEKRRNQTRRR